MLGCKGIMFCCDGALQQNMQQQDTQARYRECIRHSSGQEAVRLGGLGFERVRGSSTWLRSRYPKSIVAARDNCTIKTAYQGAHFAMSMDTNTDN